MCKTCGCGQETEEKEICPGCGNPSDECTCEEEEKE